MYQVIAARLKQGYRTAPYPDRDPVLPERLRGLPVIEPDRCPPGCRACSDACPVGAIEWDEAGTPRIDLGRCLFCTDCTAACPAGALRHTTDHRLAVSAREDLVVFPGRMLRHAAALAAELRRVLGRSLKLRQVSAGGCNACEADTNVLGTVGWDLGRFGIQFVASPRHADGLLVTGPVSQNMALALKKTYDAVSDPRIVIAVGACAISGGPYIGHKEANNGVAALIPVDLHVPGCPPNPLTILDGLLRLIGRIEDGTRKGLTANESA